MNKLLVASISLLTFYQALGAPAPQQFQTQSYQTHSIYPSYSVHHQSIPISIFPHSALSPHSYGLNAVHLNANEQKKLESNYQEILEKFKSENSHSKADGPVANSPLVSGKTLSNVDHSKSTIGSLQLTSLEHHHADPVFGPEIGSKYDIHYAPEHLISLPAFSEYTAYPLHAAFPAQPVFPSAYTDFSSFPEYPHFGGSNTFFSAAGANSPPRDPSIAIDSPPKEGSNHFVGAADVGTPPRVDSSNGETNSRPETSNESSSEGSNDSTTEGNIGAPPSIDGPKPEKQKVNPQDAASNDVSSEKKAARTSEKKAVKT